MESSVRPGNFLIESSLKSRINRATRNIPRRLQWQLFTVVLIASDLLLTGLAFLAAYMIRFELSLPFFQMDVLPSINYYQRLMLFIVPLWLLIFGFMGLYNRQNLLSGTQEYSLVFNASTFGMFAVIAASFLIPEFIFSRGWILIAWAFAFLFTAAGRFVLRRLVYFIRQYGYFVSPAIIVGANEESRLLAEQLIRWKKSGLLILGFVDDELPSGIPVYQDLLSMGQLEQIPSILSQYSVEELILTTSALTRDEMVSIFKQYGVSSNVTLRLSSGLFEIITTGLQVTELASVPLVRVNKARLNGIDKLLKFILDYAITIPGLIIISPLLLLIAVIIRLDSEGPVIYRRRVMGVNGEQFDAFKFRTMHVNGEHILASQPQLKAELEENHKLKDDPRITRLGYFLRKTSLDELPQLFNVLKREMSLVGPRMISPAEMSKYNHWGMNLLTVPPGITGLWQVSGRSDVSYDERVRLDMQYIRNWSIWLDLELLIMTIPAVFKRRGAY